MILFCDIDGVCHPLNARTDLLFSCTGRLWKILRDCPEVQLVVSSSWREQHSKAELIDFLTYGGGEDLAHRIIGVTPRTPRARSTYIAGPQPVRHNECEQWLIENGQQHRAWLALDDEALIFPQGSTTLYLVNGKTGLTEADTIAIIQRIKPAIVFGSEWGQQVLRNVQRMTVDEEYRKSIAKDLS